MPGTTIVTRLSGGGGSHVQCGRFEVVSEGDVTTETEDRVMLLLKGSQQPKNVQSL